MTVFISYNRKDEDFADRLCKELIRHHVPVWLDKWQLELGESITNSIQDAIDKASFVCLILSNNALRSKWVEREITASLVRELDEKKLSILPLVIDDCELPLFLRDKLYADFRQDFDTGLKMILNAVADKYNLFAGRITNEGKNSSFGTDVVLYKEVMEINFDIISEDDDADYFILTKVRLIGNDKALEQFKLYKEDGEASSFVHEIIGVCGGMPDMAKANVLVGGNAFGRKSFNIDSGEGGLTFRVEIVSKKVGPDDGKYVVFNIAPLFQFYKEELKNNI